MNRIKPIFQNEYVFSVFAKILQIGLGILRSVLIARYLGTYLKGENAYITSLVSVFAVIVTFGVHQAYPYFRKHYGKEKIYDDYLSSVTIVFLIYFVLSFILFYLKGASLAVRIAIVLTPLYGYANILTYILLVEDPNRRNKSYLIISALEILIILCLFLFTKSNTLASILILIISNLMEVIYCILVLRPRIRIEHNFLLIVMKLVKFGFFPMLALLMTTLNYKIDVIMLKWFPDSITTSMIGVYSIGINITDYIALIPDTLKGVLVSKLAKGADEKEVAKVCRVCFASSLFICILLMAAGRPTITLLYGKEYTDAYDIILTCGIGSVFVGFFKIIGQYNIINKKQVVNLLMLSASVVINVVLNYILIPRWQLIGAAFSSCGGYSLTGIVFVMMFIKKSGLPPRELLFITKADLESILRLLWRGGEL